MMTSSELREWRDVEHMKLLQIKNKDEYKRIKDVIFVLNAVLGDEE